MEKFIKGSSVKAPLCHISCATQREVTVSTATTTRFAVGSEREQRGKEMVKSDGDEGVEQVRALELSLCRVTVVTARGVTPGAPPPPWFDGRSLVRSMAHP